MPHAPLLALLVLFLGAAPAAAEPLATRSARLGPAPDEGPTDYGRKVALVVGIADYAAEGADLAYARGDAAAVAAVLEERYGFDEVRVLEDAQADRAGVEAAFDDLRGLAEEDLLVVYWAGHGTTRTDARGLRRGFLVPHDGALEDGPGFERNLSMAEIRTLLGEAVPARHRLLVVDACFAGVLLTRGTGARSALFRHHLARRTFQVITAGGPDQEVLDGGAVWRGRRHSVFAATLLEQLETAEDVLTGSRLGVHLQEQVHTLAWDLLRDERAQHPEFGWIGGQRGEVMLAPLGVDLRDRLEVLEASLADTGPLPPVDEEVAPTVRLAFGLRPGRWDRPLRRIWRLERPDDALVHAVEASAGSRDLARYLAHLDRVASEEEALRDLLRAGEEAAEGPAGSEPGSRAGERWTRRAERLRARVDGLHRAAPALLDAATEDVTAAADAAPADLRLATAAAWLALQQARETWLGELAAQHEDLMALEAAVEAGDSAAEEALWEAADAPPPLVASRGALARLDAALARAEPGDAGLDEAVLLAIHIAADPTTHDAAEGDEALARRLLTGAMQVGDRRAAMLLHLRAGDYFLGSSVHRRQDLAVAVEELRAAEELGVTLLGGGEADVRADLAEARHDLALALARAGRWSEAVQPATALLAMSHGEVGDFVEDADLAGLLGVAMTFLPEERVLTEEVPSRVQGRILAAAGEEAVRRQDAQAAAHFFRRAVAVAPEDRYAPERELAMARALARAGDVEGAVSALEGRYARYGPTSDWLAAHRDALPADFLAELRPEEEEVEALAALARRPSAEPQTAALAFLQRVEPVLSGCLVGAAPLPGHPEAAAGAHGAPALLLSWTGEGAVRAASAVGLESSVEDCLVEAVSGQRVELAVPGSARVHLYEEG